MQNVSECLCSLYAWLFVVMFSQVGAFLETKVPVLMSNSSTEAACLKLSFTKFACSVKNVRVKMCE